MSSQNATVQNVAVPESGGNGRAGVTALAAYNKWKLKTLVTAFFIPTLHCHHHSLEDPRKHAAGIKATFIANIKSHVKYLNGEGQSLGGTFHHVCWQDRETCPGSSCAISFSVRPRASLSHRDPTSPG